jgi:hypothetical protein
MQADTACFGTSQPTGQASLARGGCAQSRNRTVAHDAGDEGAHSCTHALAINGLKTTGAGASSQGAKLCLDPLAGWTPAHSRQPLPANNDGVLNVYQQCRTGAAQRGAARAGGRCHCRPGAGGGRAAAHALLPGVCSM